MSLSIDIHPMTDYLHATVTGEYASDAAKKGLERIMNAAHSHPVPKILIDCREVRGNPSLPERFELVAFGLKLRIDAILAGKPPRYQTAIVAKPPLAHPNRFGIRQLVERGLKVTICDRLEEALTWLGVASANPAQSPPPQA